jgi:hypothetical protein
MDFANELSEFPSAVHKCIYAAARGLTPAERSIDFVKDSEMRASCIEYHAFITDMLSDMYDYPDEYYLPVLALENFCGGKKINGMKQKYPSKTKNIIAQTRNSVGGYIKLLHLLGRSGELINKTLSIPAAEIENIEKQVNTTVSPISLDARLKALSRIGLKACGGDIGADAGGGVGDDICMGSSGDVSDDICINVDSSGGDINFISTRYPNMFPAMRALAQKADKQSGFDYFAFQTLEFRNIERKFKPTYVDYYNPLTAEQCKQANALHEFATANKINPVISTFWKVDYKYRGVHVMCIGTEGDHERLLDIRIFSTYNWDDSALINTRLAKEPPDFQKQALRHVWRCNACSTSHLGRFVTVLGKRQRVCGGGLIGFRWYNPSDGDLEQIKRHIKIRCEIIDELILAEKK